MNIIKLLLLVPVLLFPFTNSEASDGILENGWKAGVAKMVITPEKSMWMAGYGSRKRPSEGSQHDLWAKALALEDIDGRQAVLVTSDLLGMPKKLSDRLRNRLQEKFNLARSQIILNSSHTHSGPALENSLPDVYPVNENQKKEIIQYTKWLEDKLVELVGQALGDMEPAQLYAENGVTRFQVNRRNNSELVLNRQAELNGPNDYSVPVIKVVNDSGEMLAVVFGYACHPTVLNGYEWSGDYAGYAQIELEKKYPGTTALFFQGAGGDQNPLPRRTVALAQQYGETLAAAVERVLNEEMRQLSSGLSVVYDEVELKLSEPPTKEELSKIAVAENSSAAHKRWATRLLTKLERGESLMTSYPYPIQVWQLGDQLIFSLGGELVIDYAIKLKEIFGQDIFVMGYSNDVMSYIPSVRILREGGYEGERSQKTYGLPSTWAPSVEIKIINGFIELVKKENILLTQKSLQ